MCKLSCLDKVLLELFFFKEKRSKEKGTNFQEFFVVYLIIYWADKDQPREREEIKKFEHSVFVQ